MDNNLVINEEYLKTCLSMSVQERFDALMEMLDFMSEALSPDQIEKARKLKQHRV